MNSATPIYIIKLAGGLQLKFNANSAEVHLGSGTVALLGEQNSTVAEFPLAGVAGWWREDVEVKKDRY